jgi:hypothetical protein
MGLGILAPNYNKTHPNPEGNVHLPTGRYHDFLIGASMYGGPTDASTPGHTGSNGTDLTTNNGMWYAELGMGTLLGGLPYGFELEITNSSTGQSAFCKKGDIGLGGAPVDGHARRIDLWYEAAAAIGFTGVELVYITPVTNLPAKSEAILASSRATEGNTPDTLQQAAATTGDTASTVAGAAADVVTAPVALAGDVGNLFSNWKLVLLGLAGATIGIIALVEIAGSTKAGQSVAKAAPLAAA